MHRSRMVSPIRKLSIVELDSSSLLCNKVVELFLPVLCGNKIEYSPTAGEPCTFRHYHTHLFEINNEEIRTRDALSVPRRELQRKWTRSNKSSCSKFDAYADRIVQADAPYCSDISADQMLTYSRH